MQGYIPADLKEKQQLLISVISFLHSELQPAVYML